MGVDSLSDLKTELKQFGKNLGAYTTQIADAKKGFENAISGCHPKNIWKHCNSVVVFGIYVGPDYYRSIKLEKKTIGDNRIMHIFRDWLQYKVADYLREKGYRAVVPTGIFDQKKLIHRLSLKLAAYEAGLGVYGKCGIIITPKYGPRVNFGAVLTDAHLKPDKKLTNFNPCLNCQLCVDLCPPKAIHEDHNPPACHDRDKCVNFVLQLREKMGDKRFLCGYCYNSCPACKKKKPGFRLSRYRTLMDLPLKKRERLISETIQA